MAITESWLAQQIAKRRLITCRFAGQVWLFDARGVAYLPAQDTLVVSDLHFEKGSYLHSYGSPLPMLDTHATIKRLDEIVSDYSPSLVVSLGDSFHDKHSVSRMRESDLTALCELVNSVPEWHWVEGNHDPEIPPSLPGTSSSQVALQDVILRHEPEVSDSPQVIGHFHPKMTAKVRPRRFTGKCFVVTEQLMIMPAFGQYTGGLSIDDEVILTLAPKRKRQCYLLYQDTIGAVASTNLH